ncbi:hypothetical protein [Ketogulonicigenium vulgare]|uniref:hypothetical protein n=1 Tax=Ketogulonicigenium vulgare TaxID=92945 RepID=UPI002358EF6D|nr:hypothetical protein [Ketogulonicigenium vulgare]
MIISTNMQAALNSGTVRPRYLLWFTVKNRSDGSSVQIGMWTGVDQLTVNVDGFARIYEGVGSILNMSNFEFSTGLNIRTQSVNLSMLDQKAVDFIRTFDSRLGKIEIHLALMDEFEQVIDIAKVFGGILDKININQSQESYEAEFQFVSSLRNGTKTLHAKQSDESQKLRDPNDRGREYADIAGSVPVSWGSKSDLVPAHRFGGKIGFLGLL